MIFVRGEGVFLWMDDDNFVVEEDGLVLNYEVVVNKIFVFL